MLLSVRYHDVEIILDDVNDTLTIRHHRFDDKSICDEITAPRSLLMGALRGIDMLRRNRDKV